MNDKVKRIYGLIGGLSGEDQQALLDALPIWNNKQKQQFNSMHEALRRITKYDSVERLRNESENDYGLEFEEAIEMAYENMQNEAVAAINGIRKIK